MHRDSIIVPIAVTVLAIVFAPTCLAEVSTINLGPKEKIVDAADEDDIILKTGCQTRLHSDESKGPFAPRNTRLVWFTIETIERDFWFDKTESVKLLLPNVAANCAKIEEIKESGATIDNISIDLSKPQDLVTSDEKPAIKYFFSLKSISYTTKAGRMETFKLLTEPLDPDDRF